MTVAITPLSICLSETNRYGFISVRLSIATSFCNIAFTSDEIHLTLMNILFLNAMALSRAWATICGLINYGRVKKWVVTPKFGSKSSEYSLTSTSIGRNLSASKKEKNIFDTFFTKNIHQPHSYRFFSIILLIKSRVRWTHQQARQMLRRFRLRDRNLWMALYLLTISWLALERKAYFTGLYTFSTSTTYFVLAIGWMGQLTEESLYTV